MGERPAKSGGGGVYISARAHMGTCNFCTVTGCFFRCVCVSLCPEYFEVGSVFSNFLCFSSKLMYGWFSKAYFIGAGGGSALVVGGGGGSIL